MSTRKPTDLEIEQLALGELSPAREREVRAMLSDDTLADLQASNRSILADYPPHAMADRIERRLAALDGVPTRGHASTRPWLWLPVSAMAVAAAALAVWVVRTPDALTLDRATEGEMISKLEDSWRPNITRTKGDGDPKLSIQRPTGEVLIDRTPAQQGDQLQVSYEANGASHGVIVSIDGAGVVTLHFPASPQGDTRLREGKTPLPHSYTLDDAPHFERFFFVTSEQPLDVAQVQAAARALFGEVPLSEQSIEQASTRRLALPDDIEQSSIVLTK